MRKKALRSITNLESSGSRRLRLARETVKMLSFDELSRAVGGSACDTTSWTTEKKITSHR